MNVIMISGKAGAGKDTLGEELHTAFNSMYNNIAVKDSLAAQIKHVATNYFGWDGQKDELGRTLLIDLGRAGIKYNRFIWPERLEEIVYNQYKKNIDKVTLIIPDFRFVHELIYFTHKSKLCKHVIPIRISRNEIPGEVAAHQSAQTDPTEVELDAFPYFKFHCDNNSTKGAVKRCAVDFTSMMDFESNPYTNFLEDVTVEKWRECLEGKYSHIINLLSLNR